MNVPLWAWLAVLLFIVLMLALDLFAHRKAHVIGVREAALWSAVWVAFGVGFGVLVWQVYGAEFGQQYFAGYLIEKSLAVDNVFIWAIIFTYFAVPREYQHRVLFFGVLGALVFRGIFIAAGAALAFSAQRRACHTMAKLETHSMERASTPRFRLLAYCVIGGAAILIAGLWVLNDGSLRPG